MGYLCSTEGLLPTYASVGYGLLFIGLLSKAVVSFYDETDIQQPSTRSRPAASPQPGGLGILGAGSATSLQPVILVTLGWCALYYCFLQSQAAAAFWIHKAVRREANKKEDPAKDGTRPARAIDFAAVKYGRANTTGLIFVMDRSVGNMLEQTPPFLLALWLHAVTVSPRDAAFLGWLWLLLRASYPVAFAHPSMSPALWGAQRRFGIAPVSFVTWPSYALVWRLMWGAAKAVW